MYNLFKLLRYNIAFIFDYIPSGIIIKLNRILIQYFVGVGSGDSIKFSGEIRFIKRMAKTGNANVVYDIGGNKGLFTTAVLNVNSKAKIYIAEPATECVDYLKKQFSNNNNIVIIDEAVSDKIGNSLFLSDRKFSGASRIGSGKEDFQKYVTDSYEVRTNTIDNINEEFDSEDIDILKVDVEGTEFEVLKGAEKTFKENRIKFLLLEFGGSNGRPKYFFYEIYDFLDKLNYSIFRLTPGGKLIPVTYDPRIHEIHVCTMFVAMPK